MLTIYLMWIKIWNLTVKGLKTLWEKRENAGCQHISFLFPHCFDKPFRLGSLKFGKYVVKACPSAETCSTLLTDIPSVCKTDQSEFEGIYLMVMSKAIKESVDSRLDSLVLI